MAYDKVVDSAQLEAAIKASADAIREKTGDSALIQWLSDKGFAEAIAAIEVGGSNLQLASGTMIVAEDTSSLQMTHNLGVMPVAIALKSNTAVTFTTEKYFAILTHVDDANISVHYVIVNYSTSVNKKVYGNTIKVVEKATHWNEEFIMFDDDNFSVNAGDRLTWYVAGV